MGTYGAYQDLTGDTNPFPSASLWSQVDADANRPERWFEQHVNFMDLPGLTPLPTSEDVWGDKVKAFSSSGATAATADEFGGARSLIEATDDEGVVIGGQLQPFRMTEDDGEVVFEARVARNEITGTWGSFVGLIDSQTFTVINPIVAAGTMITTANFVGFQNEEGDPDAFNSTYQANGVTQVTIGSDAVTVVADTYVKLGMTFNRGGDNVMRWYKDGVELVDNFDTTGLNAGDDFPNDIRMGWVVAMLNGATAACRLDVDWVRVAQKRTAGVV